MGGGWGEREGEAATRPRRHKTEAAAHVRELAISTATRFHLTLFFLAFPSIPSSSFLTKQNKSCSIHRHVASAKEVTVNLVAPRASRNYHVDNTFSEVNVNPKINGT